MCERDLTVPPLKTLLARALYDNQAEFPSEISFKRGDIVTVLDRNPEGYEGWWICSLNGQLGIAPGNRLEVLGLLNKTEQDTNDDVYDDPSDWTLSAENNKPQIVPVTTRDSSLDNRLSVYENVDYRTSTAGLTDSGNYSNRSSDVSLSLHSLAGASSVGMPDMRTQRKTPDSQYEDYEDLDCTQEMEFATDPSSRGMKDREPTCKNVRRMIHADLSSLVKQRNNPEICRTATRLPNAPTFRHFSAQSVRPNGNRNELSPRQNPKITSLLDVENCSANSSDSYGSIDELDVLKSGFFDNQQDIFTALNSKAAFMDYFPPLRNKIVQSMDHLLAMFKNSVKNDVAVCAEPTDILTSLNDDIFAIAQMCVILIAFSKEFPDNGLVRRFVIFKRTFDQVMERITRCAEEFRKETQKISQKKPQLLNELDRAFKLTSQTMNALNTTVLANSTLLFSPQKVLTRPISTGSRNSSMSCRTAGANFVCKLSSSVPSLTSVNCSIKPPKAVRIGTPKMLPQKLEKGLKDIEKYCERSYDSTQKFLNSLQPATLGVGLGRQETALTPLTSALLNGLVKDMLHKNTMMIRSIARVCSLISGLNSSTSPKKTDGDLVRLRTELELRGNNICESLKGLVIQTKEATRYLSSDTTTLSTEGKRIGEGLAIPAPLLQRLSGAGRTVGTSIVLLRDVLHQLNPVKNTCEAMQSCSLVDR